MSMKSLPRSPVPSTATTLTATIMTKAFQKNHHKRGLAEMMNAPPPTPTAQSSPSSYLDCQSLQTSLKRVRLSSSPGELRLQRDLRQLESSGTWQRVNGSSASNNGGGDVWIWHPPAPPITARCTSGTSAASGSARPTHISLTQVETLRLRLTVNTVVLWIQIPRLFPHRPPLISRIVYNHNNRSSHHQQSNHNNNLIQSILVQEAPPEMRGEETRQQDAGMEMSSWGNTCNNQNVVDDQENHNQHQQQNTTTLHCANTVVYHNWSPVQRLGDLLEFVIDVIQKQQDSLLTESTTNNNIDVPLTYSSSSLSSAGVSASSSWSRRNSSSSSIGSSSNLGGGGNNNSGYRTSSSSSVFPGWNSSSALEDSTGMMAMTMATHDEGPLGEEFLNPKRFDVGYNREKPPISMDLDDLHHHHHHHQLAMNDHNDNMINAMMMEDL